MAGGKGVFFRQSYNVQKSNIIISLLPDLNPSALRWQSFYVRSGQANLKFAKSLPMRLFRWFLLPFANITAHTH